MIAVGLFGLTAMKQERVNRTINYIASCTFGVYLLHFSIVDVFFKKFFPIDAYIEQSGQLILYLALMVLGLFFSCMLVEIGRKQFEKLYSGKVNKIGKKIEMMLVDYMI